MTKHYILFFLFIAALNDAYGQQPYYSYTFQVNQTCTSCCTATACISFTYACGPAPAVNYALITSTTTTPLWTINPCFSNLCNGTYTALINGIASNDACMICTVTMTYGQSTTIIKDKAISEHPSLQTFPNPSKGNININLTGVDTKLVIKIINALGQEIYSIENCYSKSYSINGIEKGLYFVLLKKDNELLERKRLIVTD